MTVYAVVQVEIFDREAYALPSEVLERVQAI